MEVGVRPEEVRSWLWLIDGLNPGNKRVWEILDDFQGDVESAAKSIENGSYSKITQREKERFQKVRIDTQEQLMRSAEGKEWHILTYYDKKYPPILRNIYNPPGVLFCMGDPYLTETTASLTVVGTRQPTNYSVEITDWLCMPLALDGVVLNSGYALGIDSMVHKAALKARSKTIAVLACGIDVNYPALNADVKPIIARYGALITELFPGTSVSSHVFHMRNRILAGMGRATLVIQAPKKSGALITANIALQEGRDVFCMPPADLRSEDYSGGTNLLMDGAIPVYSPEDLLSYFSSYDRVKPFPRREASVAHIPNVTTPPQKPEQNENKSDPKKPSAIPANAHTSTVNNLAALSNIQRKICDCLAKQPGLDVNGVAENIDLVIDEVLSDLTELELLGIVVCGPGHTYSLQG